MNNKEQRVLIEDLFKQKKSKERAIRIWFLRVEGKSISEIAEKEGIGRTAVWNYLNKIKRTGAVLQTEGLTEMKEIYKTRKELLIVGAFKDLEKAETITERSKIRRELSHHLDTLADAFWRTAKKEEKVSEESPLSLVRQWVTHGKLPGDEP